MRKDEASTSSGSNSSPGPNLILEPLRHGSAKRSHRLLRHPPVPFGVPSVKNSREANWNAYDQSPFNSQPGNKRGCDDETNDLAWRCCPIVAIRTCRPGVGAARHYQSGLVRPILSECQLPELRARKPLHELWLAASRASSLRRPSPSPPPLVLTPASEPVQTLPSL